MGEYILIELHGMQLSVKYLSNAKFESVAKTYFQLPVHRDDHTMTYAIWCKPDNYEIWSESPECLPTENTVNDCD